MLRGFRLLLSAVPELFQRLRSVLTAKTIVRDYADLERLTSGRLGRVLEQR